MTQWHRSSPSLRQTTCRRWFGLQEMCRSVERAYCPHPSSPSLSLHQSVLSLSLCKTSGSRFLGHHGKSLVIIFSALSFPTHTLSLASSLPLLMKLWIMLVSKSLQGLRRGSTNHKAAAFFSSFRLVNHDLNYRGHQTHYSAQYSPEPSNLYVSKLDGVTKWQTVFPIVGVFFYPTCHPPPIFYGRTMEKLWWLHDYYGENGGSQPST